MEGPMNNGAGAINKGGGSSTENEKQSSLIIINAFA